MRGSCAAVSRLPLDLCTLALALLGALPAGAGAQPLPRREGHLSARPRLLPAHLIPLCGHRLQPDHLAQPAGSHEPEEAGLEVPVLPAGEGAVFSRAAVLPLLHVRTRVYGARQGHPSVPLSASVPARAVKHS